MKKLNFTLFILIIATSIFSQNINTSKDLIKDVGSIEIPESMELKSGNYKEISDFYQNEMAKQFDYEVSDNRIVFF